MISTSKRKIHLLIIHEIIFLHIPLIVIKNIDVLYACDNDDIQAKVPYLLASILDRLKDGLVHTVCARSITPRLLGVEIS